MEPHESYMRLLGLALKGGNLVAGSDAVQAAAYAGQARLLLLSADASPHACREAELCAERGNCLMIALPCDKAELGGALGRGAVAIAALTDTGLAAAVAERLSALDADRYGAIAGRLRLKSKRAGERRAGRARARPNDTPQKAAARPNDTPQKVAARPKDKAEKAVARPADKAPKAAPRSDSASRKAARPHDTERKAARPKDAERKAARPHETGRKSLARPKDATRKPAARPNDATRKASTRPNAVAPAKRGAASGKLRGRPPNPKKPPKP